MMGRKIALVTGATDGIGYETVRLLGSAGCHVLVHGRDPARCAATIARLGLTGTATPLVADFSRLDEVVSLARGISARFQRLDLLVNNAGIGLGGPGAVRETSPDGFELRLAVNYLAPAVLTRALVPLLAATPRARVVNVASGAQMPIDFDDPMLLSGYDGMRAYAQSKLALVMLTFDLADELAPFGIAVDCLHPGSLLDTKMVRESFPRALGHPRDGARHVVRLCLAEDGGSGRYFDQAQESRALATAYDADARARLRAMTREWMAEAGVDDVISSA